MDYRYTLLTKKSLLEVRGALRLRRNENARIEHCAECIGYFVGGDNELLR